MSMPWDAAPPPPPAPAPPPPPLAVLTAEQMQPDTPTPAVVPPPVPAIATNTVTGQRVAVDIGGPLRAAIDQAIAEAVTAHPVLGSAVTAVVRDRERADRTLMQSSLIDVVVAVLAALVTVVSPDSRAVGVLWLAAAVLASRTMIQAALNRMVVTP